MNVLALHTESYPSDSAASHVLLHQSLALEEHGHRVHLFNLSRPPMRLRDFLDGYDFDLLYLDLDLLRDEDLRHTLQQYRRRVALHAVGVLYRLPAPPAEAWDLVDFSVTPWKGATIEAMSGQRDLRYLPLGYDRRLHGQGAPQRPLGPVFVGRTSAGRRIEAESRLKALRADRVVLCIGPEFDQKYLDPFMLGKVYGAARCLPNFHYSREKGDDCMLNERFWQIARSGIPVNDRSPLMCEVWADELLESFSFTDLRQWQERIRELNTGDGACRPELLEDLRASMEGHSYHNRMRRFLEWLA